MTSILSEKEYQHFIMDRLSQDNGYIVRKATSYDRLFAIDRELLFQFLNDTQPDEMVALRKIYKADLEDTLVNFINAEVTKARGSLLNALKHGIEISNMKLELMYTKPATTFNRELLARYEKNIFSVMDEVWASDDERIDLVIFLNGIAIMSFELKCNAAGQSYQDAILLGLDSDTFYIYHVAAVMVDNLRRLLLGINLSDKAIMDFDFPGVGFPV